MENSLLPLDPFSAASCRCSAQPKVLRSVACSSKVPETGKIHVSRVHSDGRVDVPQLGS